MAEEKPKEHEHEHELKHEGKTITLKKSTLWGVGVFVLLALLVEVYLQEDLESLSLQAMLQTLEMLAARVQHHQHQQ